MANITDLSDFYRKLDLFLDEHFFVFKLDTIWKVMVWLLMMGSLAIGSIAKLAIYSHIFKTKIIEQPINILIFVQNFLNHQCNLFNLTSLSVSFLFEWSIKEMIDRIGFFNGDSYCLVFTYSFIFMVSHSTVDGLSIAIVRLLYIKKGSWLRYNFGEMKLIKMSCIFSIVISALFTIMFGHELNSNRSVYNLCIGRSQKFQVRLFWSLTGCMAYY